MEEDTKSVKGQLLSVCPSLDAIPSLDPLISVWQGVRVRMFMHYQLSARAYFHFLKLSGSFTLTCTLYSYSSINLLSLPPFLSIGEQAGTSPGLDDMNVTASLRLLRLLVKYAGELKNELEAGFTSTPTKPWKGKLHVVHVHCKCTKLHISVTAYMYSTCNSPNIARLSPILYTLSFSFLSLLSLSLRYNPSVILSSQSS